VIRVDAEDEWMLNTYSWCPFPGKGKTYYHAVVDGQHTMIHRLVMRPKPDEVVDHINGDTSDNRKANLRICSIKENARNRRTNRTSTTGLKGVSPAGKGKWRARIRTDKGRVHLGCFDTPNEAHEAYKIAAVKYHGEFASI